MTARAISSLARDGLQVCLSHAQATNLRSVNTFLSLGWQHAGWMLASRGGRYLGKVGVHRDLRVIRGVQPAIA